MRSGSGLTPCLRGVRGLVTVLHHRRRRVLPLLEEHGVHLYFSGHDHGLQHVKHASVTGPDLYVSGAGGYRLHPQLKDESDAAINKQASSLFKLAEFGASG